ncbi:MAG: 3'-5' exonuclease, partial [Chloroflexi bacterium]|nr:3'-5' exonuclease [Chloroflexota bacterium]
MPVSERYVAIDLETTGFDPAVEHIIEVGAVRFGRGGRAQRFSSLVRPNRGIPREVQALTGIRDIDLLSAPPLAAVLGELRAFAAGCVPVGHNVQFDLAFLEANGLALGPRSYDTFDLASVLLTGATQLQLAAVAGALGVAMPVAHRALADADATHTVFLRLLDRLDALPRAVLLDLLAVTEPLAWGLRELVAEAVARGGGGLPEVAGVLVPQPPVSRPQM